MNYLTPDQLASANEKIIDSSGGTRGSLNEANLHHVCERAKSVSKEVVQIAAYYFYFLAFQAHAFTDGNKRTAIAALVEFLVINKRKLDATDEELVGFALLTASGNASKTEVEKWLKTRIKIV